MGLFGGVLQCSMPHFGGALPFLSEFWFVETNQGRIPSIFEGGWIRIEGQEMILGKIHN
jgi:hypothetical protein